MGSAVDHHRAEWHRQMQERLNTEADRIASARVVAEALNRGAEAERENAQLKQENRKMAAKLNFPYLSSIPKVLQQTHHDVEADAKRFHQKAESIRERSQSVFDRAHSHLAAPTEHLDALSEHLDEVERSLEGSNGGPLPGDSETSSGS